MSHVANLVKCHMAHYIPHFSCYIAKVEYNIQCVLYNTSQPSRCLGQGRLGCCLLFPLDVEAVSNSDDSVLLCLMICNWQHERR